MIKRYIIKPCPFCGGTGKLHSATLTQGTMPRFRVGCLNARCPAYIYSLAETAQHPCAEDAIDTWNKRFGLWRRLWRSIKLHCFPYL